MCVCEYTYICVCTHKPVCMCTRACMCTHQYIWQTQCLPLLDGHSVALEDVISGEASFRDRKWRAEPKGTRPRTASFYKATSSLSGGSALAYSSETGALVGATALLLLSSILALAQMEASIIGFPFQWSPQPSEHCEFFQG